MEEGTRKRGGRDTEVEMRLGTSRAFIVITGKEKVETTGTSMVRHMVERVEDDELVGKKGSEAHGAFVIERTGVVAGGGGVVIQPGVFGVSRVKRTANKIIGAISVCFERL